MSSLQRPRVKFLVVDTAAFIKTVPLQDFGESMYTLPEVLDEIKDKAAKQHLQVLPYELNFRIPSPELLQLVTDVSKKTGDYPSLSSTDLKVLALTCLLEKEHVGTDHWKTDVDLPEINTMPEDRSAMPGFHAPATSQDETDEADDDDSDWISPDNIEEVVKLLEPATTFKDKAMEVACMTTDFAMQNVLLHMGLNVVSLDGFHIKRIKTYILRCHACFKTTSIMTKAFCPHCGNKTLKRVAVNVNDDGKQYINVNFRRPINLRGTKYSLPMPKGGKHANNPILCEDQRVPQQRMTNAGRKNLDVFDPDYVAQPSPFKMRDLYSRAATIGIKGDQPAYFERRNPNVVKKTNKKKR